MGLLRATMTISSLTLLSRLFGFVRDMLMARLLGASWLSDAFFVAFKLPNFFRRLFAEGAFNAAFIPQYNAIQAATGQQQALLFAGRILTLLTLSLLILSAVMMTAMPWLLQWIAPGFRASAEKYDITVTLARICFPYILFISLVSLLGGILNSAGRFAAAAATPVLLNIALIIAMLGFADQLETPAHALSWGVCAAGALQLLWLVAEARRHGLLPRFARPVRDAELRHFFRLLAPAALGAGVMQVNLLVDIIIGSFLPEAVSYLYYADRLNELPIGVIGVAVGTALLPLLSRQIKQGELAAANHSMNRAIELIALLGVPCMVAFLTIPQPIIQVLYEHGAFTPEDTRATYVTLMAYTLGLPAFLLVKILAPGFYAAHDTRTPFRIAIVCVATNAVLNLVLMQFLAHVGLALATSIAGWLNAGLMAMILIRRGMFTPDALLARRVIKITASSIAMGLVVWLIHWQTQHWMVAGTGQQISGLLLLVIAGMTSYAIFILALRVMRISELKQLLRRQSKS